jgi:hypothetical protein
MQYIVVQVGDHRVETVSGRGLDETTLIDVATSLQFPQVDLAWLGN